MQRNKEQPFERQSRFNENRSSYLDADFNYVYKYQELQKDGTYITKECVIPYSEKMRDIFIFLDREDHKEDLARRYAEDNADLGFRNAQKRYADSDGGNDDGDDTYGDPVESIPDPNADVVAEAFPEYAEKEPENPLASELRKWIFTLPESQQDLIFAHMGEMKFLEDIRREEELATGKKISKQAMHNRWNKILEKACKYLGVEKPKQEHKAK